MALYNKSLTAKLNSFLESLLEIKQRYNSIEKAPDADTNAARSSASDDMQDSMIWIVQNILANNSSMPKPALIDNIKIHLAFIDGNTSTYLPTIFNEHSLELSQALHNFLTQIKNSDFTLTSKVLLKPFGDLDKLEQYNNSLAREIQFYETIKRSHEKKISELNAFNAIFDGIEAALEVKKTDNYDEKIKNALIEIDNLFKSIDNSHVRFSATHEFYNSGDSFRGRIFDLETIKVKGGTTSLSVTSVIAQNITAINNMLITNYDPNKNLSTEFLKIKTKFDESLMVLNNAINSEAIVEKAILFNKIFTPILTNYPKSSSFYNKKDPAKLALAKEIQQFLEQFISIDFNFGMLNLFNIYVRCRHFQYKNLDISAENKIASGNLGNILNDMVSQIHDILFNDLKPTNDADLALVVKSCLNFEAPQNNNRFNI